VGTAARIATPSSWTRIYGADAAVQLTAVEFNEISGVDLLPMTGFEPLDALFESDEVKTTTASVGWVSSKTIARAGPGQATPTRPFLSIPRKGIPNDTSEHR
jgi:hypothetical protein